MSGTSGQAGLILDVVRACAVNEQGQQSDNVAEKAHELLRKMTAKVPAGVLGKVKNCRHVVAIALAFKVENVSYYSDKLLQYAGASNNEFKRALKNCESLLNLTFTQKQSCALDVLTIKLGVEFKAKATEILSVYRETYVNTLEKSRQVNINLNAAEYHAGAFFMATKLQGQKMDKRRVLQIAEVSPKVFDRTVKELERVYDGKIQKSIAYTNRKAETVKIDGLHKMQKRCHASMRASVDITHDQSMVRKVQESEVRIISTDSSLN